MAVLHRPITLSTSDKEFDDVIFEYYDDFKKFMKYNNLPDFKINYITIPTDTSVAYVDLPKDSKQPYVLNVRKDLLSIMGRKAIPALYHEFTHIYDNEVCKYNLPHRKMYLMAYMEFHATIIQMMVATGYDYFDSNSKISLQSIIADGSRECTCKEYFEFETSNAKSLKVDTLDIKTSVNNLYNAFLYYVGKMYFAQQHIKEDTSGLFSLEPFINMFGEYTTMLKMALFENKTTEQHFFIEGEFQSKMIDYFVNKYKSNKITFHK